MQPQKIAYLWFDDQSVQQLFLTDSEGAEPVQVSAATVGQAVTDFAPSPDGNQIIYGQRLSGSTSGLYLVDVAAIEPERTPLLTCEQAVCQNSTWAHDNRKVIYERRDVTGGTPRLYWLDTVTAETRPVFSDSDEQVIGYHARLSADDTMLSFVHMPADDPNLYGDGQPRTILFALDSGDQKILTNLMNAPAVWHPATPRLLIPNMEFFGEKFGIHLFTYNVDEPDNAPTNLSEALTVEDSVPNWSATGEMIVFSRKRATVNMGSQIWVMEADGSDAHPLTEHNDIHHGVPQWSADDTQILHQRFNLKTPQGSPSIWLHDVETGEAEQIVAAGSQPRWLAITP